MNATRKIALLILLWVMALGAMAQESAELRDGVITYVGAQNVYVKFATTENIRPGDTLFVNQNGVKAPALMVRSVSSVSTVCVVLGSRVFTVGEILSANIRKISPSDSTPVPKEPPRTMATGVPDTAKPAPSGSQKPRQDINGNVTVASYLNFSDVTGTTQRMRYTLNLNAENIDGSGLSAETYITFAHKIGEWSEISDDIFNGLKIYNLSANYRFNAHHQLWFGRKINPRISNVGAIDGLQYEYRANAWSFGAVGGSRPDYRDYSFNAGLFQAGAYVGHDLSGRNGAMQTTVAFMQQMNNGHTDRRFAYLQHSNALIKNLYFFGSMEVDLYKMTKSPEDSVYRASSSPDLSNLYVSLRYRPVKMLSLSLSYSSRQNVIFYETYKDYLETLLQQATVNGWMAQIIVRPVRQLTVGLNGSYRDSKNDPKATKSLYGYATWAMIPGIRASGTLSATLLETSYMNGNIYSLRFSRDLAGGKLNAGLGYRFVDYRFAGNLTSLLQHMPEVNLTWRILKKLSCSLYYEGTFDKSSTFNRIYINFTQRF